VGILWFYWVGNSFVYYGLEYLKYPIIILFGFSYGILFLLSSMINYFLVRLVLFFSLTFIHPFGFNWFKPELILLNTYLNPFEIKQNKPKLKIYMPQFNIKQNEKWKEENKENIIAKNLKEIDYAIQNNYDLVVFPETSFPLVIDYYPRLLEILLEKSHDIDIVIGALSLNKENQYLNSTIHFSKAQYKIANKVVLVPFGEATPLPKFLVDFINDTFFNGASDYQSVSEPTSFDIKGIKFRNAICYEATSDEVYKNLDTNYILASSNNAWFTPSIEPTLQKLLLQYYAYKYNLYIIHSVNGSQNTIIK